MIKETEISKIFEDQDFTRDHDQTLLSTKNDISKHLKRQDHSELTPALSPVTNPSFVLRSIAASQLGAYASQA